MAFMRARACTRSLGWRQRVGVLALLAGAELDLESSSDGSVPLKKLCIVSCKFGPSGTGAGGAGSAGQIGAWGTVAQLTKSIGKTSADSAQLSILLIIDLLAAVLFLDGQALGFLGCDKVRLGVSRFARRCALGLLTLHEVMESEP